MGPWCAAASQPAGLITRDAATSEHCAEFPRHTHTRAREESALYLSADSPSHPPPQLLDSSLQPQQYLGGSAVGSPGKVGGGGGVEGCYSKGGCRGGGERRSNACHHARSPCLCYATPDVLLPCCRAAGGKENLRTWLRLLPRRWRCVVTHSCRHSCREPRGSGISYEALGADDTLFDGALENS